MISPRSALSMMLPLVLAACGGAAMPGAISPAMVERARARWPDASAESLEKGRQLFVARCNACHAYPEPSAHPDDRWPSITQRMAGKAKLGAADGELVLRFVLASRESGAGSGSAAAR